MNETNIRMEASNIRKQNGQVEFLSHLADEMEILKKL
jgi:hypothetical protein